MIRSIVVTHGGPQATAAMLPDELRNLAAAPAASAHNNVIQFSASAAIKPLWQMEKDCVTAALTATNQDVTRAAQMLEVSPSTLYRKLQMWKEGG